MAMRRTVSGVAIPSMVVNRGQDLAERHARIGLAAARADATGFNPPRKGRHAVAGMVCPKMQAAI